MNEVHVRDLVVNIGDRGVVGQVLSTSAPAADSTPPPTSTSGTPVASPDSVTPASCQCGGIPTAAQLR